MELLYATLLIITILGMAAWMFLGGFVFRNPFVLYITGFVLALVGGYLSYSLQEIAANGEAAKYFTDLKLAAALVSYTIAAAGGSLIASGILLKAQHMAKADKISAKRAVNIVANNIEMIHQQALQLRDNPTALTIAKQEEQRLDLRLRLYEQRTALDKALERLEQMDYP
ncbi:MULTISPECIES: hypothetical protein [Pseudomonas]|jgi:hypothetical protein|uniref:Uncharacterized protein n=1 Tax=Pseudomonas fluorescens TaxID=294 RepID=A0A7Z6MW32_PSEFL|nr:MULTISPECIES: hypothetical protein [Pseudomonas]MBY8949526.1 hypothetical protein [Pseudomonas sp. SH10-3B]RDS90071.1 hypothetical protein DL347_14790 [Pseudomonas fluorescens]SFS27206.1 hypothetical protein SAMN03159318_03499 [Pseudomonas sp. NFACC42-2]